MAQLQAGRLSSPKGRQESSCGFQVFAYFKSSSVILCSWVHYGGGHEGCFAEDFSFVLVWGLCFSPCRAGEAVSLLELLEEEQESVLLPSGDVSLCFLS